MNDCFENEEENIGNNILNCCRCFPVQRLVDLNLGSGGAGPFTVTVGTVLTLTAPVNVVSVSVDADECRIDPCLRECGGELRVLLTFIADISTNTLSLGTTLNFYLVRSSDCGSVILGPLSTFTLTTGLGTPLAVAHAFEYVDRDVEPGNYTYSVQIAPGSTVTGAVVLGSSAVVNRATLSAVAAFV